VSQDLTKAIPKQPRKLVNDPLYLHPDIVTHTTQDALHRPNMLKPESLALATLEHSPKQDFRTPREGLSSKVCS